MPLMTSLKCCTLRTSAIAYGIVRLVIHVAMTGLLLFDWFNEKTDTFSDAIHKSLITSQVILSLTILVLIIGAFLREKYMILAWWAFELIVLFISTCKIVYFSLSSPVFLAGFVIFGVFYFFWVVVLAFYLQLYNGAEATT